MALEFRQPRDFGDAAQKFLPRLVGRVRLAGEQEQHRPFGTGDDLAQQVEVLEQQGCALVGGETARKSDRQHVRVAGIGKLEDTIEVRLRAMIARVLSRDTKSGPDAASAP